MEPPSAARIAGRWRDGGRSTLAVIGESYDGPFGIDISKDGPHALIAGTTGSGKSELLQTIVASLAVANRPDEMTFVLIDYKGGSAFAECALLPHTVGMVTDLDPHQVERALVSLTAELTRRERILAAAGAKDIEAYQLLVDGRRAPSLPRLVIVVDEFAAMSRDLPDFVTGLVNIAQRGRSLGLHLMLATQRPSGVVSAEIRANTNLRIALRVTDPVDSADVIGVPDAATIGQSNPGRAYVRLGHASLVPFQAGRVGGRRPGAGPAATAAPWVAPVEWAMLGKPEPARPAGPARREAEITDLTVLVEEIRRATSGLRIQHPHRPWLAPLPPSLLLHDLMPASPGPERPAGGPPACVFGLVDLPTIQQQQSAVLALDSFTHLMAAGAPRSGRSQLLRTIAGALALAHSPADVHLYGIDCGNGALLPLAELPHCGAVVSRAQTERAARLLRRLAAELSRRQEAARRGRVRRHPGATGRRRRGGAAAAHFRAARPVGGIHRHAGGTRGRQSHRNPHPAAHRGGQRRHAPGHDRRPLPAPWPHLVAVRGEADLQAGREGRLPAGRPQPARPARRRAAWTGLPGRLRRRAAGGAARARRIRARPGRRAAGHRGALPASATRRFDATRRPFRVDVLPSRVSFAEAWQLRPVSAGPLWGLVGVGGDTLAALGPDLASGMPCFIVAGPGQVRAVHHPAVHGEIVPRGRNTGSPGRAAAVPAARAGRRPRCAGSVRPAGAGRSRTGRRPGLVRRARCRADRRRGTAARLRRGRRTEPPDRPRGRCRARPRARRGRREHRRRIQRLAGRGQAGHGAAA